MKKQLTLEGEVVEQIIPPGKIKCFITGKLRRDTPEERVRQEVARSLVEEYGYDKKDMDVEFYIKIGTAKKPVDIAIFYPGKKHIQENIYIIVETKREDIKPSDKKEGISQLKSYLAASLNAKFGLWVGSERISLQVVEKAGKKDFVPIPDIPPKGETTAPRPTRGSLVPAINLKRVFRRIHNYIYVNQGLPKDKAFEELQKLIFIKVYDEQYSPRLQFYILPDEDVSQVRERLLEVFKKVKALYYYIFKKEETIELNDRVLAYAIGELQRFSLVDTDVDVKGEAYEEIVGPNLRGDRGEFFTPRSVCRMSIDMLFSLFSEEKLTSAGAIKILDPAVGTGGFLIVAIQRIKQILMNRGYQYDKLRKLIREIADTNLFGIDFNPFLVKVAQMNMVMHGNGSANIVHANSLEHPSLWPDEVLFKFFKNEIDKHGGVDKFRKYLALLQKPEEIEKVLSQFDIVVTNPPFGTKAVIDDPDILSQFQITSFNTSTPRSSLPPEQLFIERCLQFLKPGGVLAIVLPDSILTNPGLTWLREWILMNAYVLASIDLPVETFEPHVGTKTSVLVLRKKTEEQKKLKEDYEIFMAIPEKIGHDRRGNPIYKLTSEGKIELNEKGQPIIEDHLPIVAELFKEWIKKRGIACG
jgi:type I restriction enzyme M protein